MGTTNSVPQDNPTMEKLYAAFRHNRSADALEVVQFIKTGVAEFNPNAVFRGLMQFRSDNYSGYTPKILKAILASAGIKINKKWFDDYIIDIDGTKPVWLARIFSILDHNSDSNWDKVFQELVTVSRCNIITDTFCGVSVFSLMHEICIAGHDQYSNDEFEEFRGKRNQTRYLPYTPVHRKLAEQVATHEFTRNCIPELITRRSALVLRDLLETNRSIRKYINQGDYLRDIEMADIKTPYTVLKPQSAWTGTYEPRSSYIEPLLNAGQNNPAYTLAIERQNIDSIDFYAKRCCIIKETGDTILSRLIVAGVPLATITTVLDQAVERKIDIFTVPFEGSYPLHLACRDEKLFNKVQNIAAKILTDAHIITKLKDKDGRTPLHVLYSVCDVTFSQNNPLFTPDSVSQTDNNLDTPLHIACRHLRAKGVEQLLDTITKNKLRIIDATNKSGNTPLFELVSQKVERYAVIDQMTLVKLLLAHNADPSASNIFKNVSCIKIAFIVENYEIAKVLLNHSNTAQSGDAVAHTQCASR
jgi:hypothetical protein